MSSYGISSWARWEKDHISGIAGLRMSYVLVRGGESEQPRAFLAEQSVEALGAR